MEEIRVNVQNFIDLKTEIDQLRGQKEQNKRREELQPVEQLSALKSRLEKVSFYL